MAENKSDKVIWWLMITFASVIIVGGGAWATDMTQKVEKIGRLEVNIQYIQNDLSQIKNIIQKFSIRGE